MVRLGAQEVHLDVLLEMTLRCMCEDDRLRNAEEELVERGS